jgi:hypothetical protein
MYWGKLFDVIDELCEELGCLLMQSFQITNQATGVRMDWSLGLNREVRIAGESKIESVLAHHQVSMEGLAEEPWLGWEHEIHNVEGGKAIVLKVSFHFPRYIYQL